MTVTDPVAQHGARKATDSEAPKRSQFAEIRFPEGESWGSLIRTLRLKHAQADILAATIKHVILDLGRYRKRKEQRSVLVQRLKLMEQAFGRLQFEMNRSAHLMSDFLPFDTLEFVGESLTFTAMAQVLGQRVFPRNFGTVLDRMKQQNEPITIAALEEHLSAQRRSLGLNQGHVLLKHFIDSVGAPLRNWVEIDKLNKGGRPANAARQYMIWRLADVAPQLIGRRAPISRTGAFVDLCEQVLIACGFPEESVGKAVEAVVRKRRDQERLPRRIGKGA
jgi:hypothetical protein